MPLAASHHFLYLLYETRLYSVPPSRARASIPAALEGVSNLREGGYTFPCLAALSKHRVLVTTLVTAGRLASAQFPQGHFGHIFIDEAAQVPRNTLFCSSTIDLSLLIFKEVFENFEFLQTDEFHYLVASLTWPRRRSPRR